MDARQFFLMTIDLTGSLPESNLRVARGMIDTTMIPKMVNVPYGQLLGSAEQGEAMPSYSGQESPSEYRSADTGEAPVGQRTFSRVPGPIKAALAGARSKYPNIRVADLMMATVPPLKYTSIKVGPTGACLDMLCLGTCKEAGCTYKHPTTRVGIDPTRAVSAAIKLKLGYAAYTASHPN
jgi:hypothetical protein